MNKGKQPFKISQMNLFAITWRKPRIFSLEMPVSVLPCQVFGEVCCKGPESKQLQPFVFMI